MVNKGKPICSGGTTIIEYKKGTKNKKKVMKKIVSLLSISFCNWIKYASSSVCAEYWGHRTRRDAQSTS